MFEHGLFCDDINVLWPDPWHFSGMFFYVETQQ